MHFHFGRNYPFWWSHCPCCKSSINSFACSQQERYVDFCKCCSPVVEKIATTNHIVHLIGLVPINWASIRINCYCFSSLTICGGASYCDFAFKLTKLNWAQLKILIASFSTCKVILSSRWISAFYVIWSGRINMLNIIWLRYNWCSWS